MEREEAIERIKTRFDKWALDDEDMKAIQTLIPELFESEDENLKNKSGYYKAGKFWKASTLWNAVKGKSPQRVPNRYILQECTWNIGTLQRFADEVKNVQEVNLDYPIILDINGNILDGAHRVVKAYLEGKDIDIVYLGDDEWPEPDYDEEKAVKEREDEKHRKWILEYLHDGLRKADEQFKDHFKAAIAWFEKQKEQKPVDNEKVEITDFEQAVYDLCPVLGIEEAKATASDLLELAKKTLLKTGKVVLASNYPEGCSFEDGFHLGYSEGFNAKQEQKPAEWNANDRAFIKDCARILDENFYTESAERLLSMFPVKPAEWSEEDEKMVQFWNMYYEHEVGDWSNKDVVEHLERFKEWLNNRLKSLRPSWKPSEEQMLALRYYLNNVPYSLHKERLESLYNDLN